MAHSTANAQNRKTVQNCVRKPMNIWSWTAVGAGVALLFCALMLAFPAHSQDKPKPSLSDKAGKTSPAVAPPTAATVSVAQKTPDTNDAKPKKDDKQKARIDLIAFDNHNLYLTKCATECDGAAVTVTYADNLASTIQSLRAQDRISYTADGQSVLQTIKLSSREINKTDRIQVMVCAALFYLAVTSLLTWWHPLKLITGQDNRYSNSKFQIFAWFSLLITVYLSTIFLRVTQLSWDLFGGVNIPPHLLLLSGLSALTYGAAKGITVSKVDQAIAKGIADPKPSGIPNFWHDMTHNDQPAGTPNSFDLGDFQMFLVTLLALGTYTVVAFHFLHTISSLATVPLPDVDTTILASFGLGHGAYLAKKSLGDVRTS